MITRWLLLALCAVPFIQACGDSERMGQPKLYSASPILDGAAGGTQGLGSSDAGGDSAANASDNVHCEAIIEAHPAPSFDHVTTCSEVHYDTNPPSGGNHYPIWPAFQEYTFPVPEGFLVHALEHGAVVIWYNCPDGCTAEVAEAEAFINTLPQDPLCDGTGAPRRVILTPDPNLATRWAASSWGYTLRASCFNASAFSDFCAAHYGNGREVECAAGMAFTANPCP